MSAARRAAVEAMAAAVGWGGGDAPRSVPSCSVCSEPIAEGGVKDGDEHFCRDCWGEEPEGAAVLDRLFDTLAKRPKDLFPASVLDEVAQERRRQDRKWGRQDYPDGTGLGLEAAKMVVLAPQAQEACSSAFAAGRCTYGLVLVEEVAEALAETDPARLRAELIQVAAVAVQWVEAIDRRRRG